MSTIVLSEEGESIELVSLAEELVSCYGLLEGGIPDDWTLPYPSDTIKTWDLLHSQRRFDLLPAVEDLVDYLQVKSIPIIPAPWQMEAISKSTEILGEYRACTNTSPLGSGKTYMTGYIAQRLEMATLAIVPASLVKVWSVMRLALPNLIIITYGKLRGKRVGDGSFELSHGLLTRKDWTTTIKVKGKGLGGGTTTEEIQHHSFHPTDKLRRMCRDGLFVIMDEVQALKNDSAQQRACNAVLDAVREGELSVCTLLSGSPFDKPEHAFQMMKTLGYIKSSQYLKSTFDMNGYKLEQIGTKEARDSCMAINSEATRRIAGNGMPYNKKSAVQFVWDLYQKVVAPALTVASSRPSIPYDYNIGNGLYTFGETDATKYAAALADLKASMRENSAGRIVVDFTNLASCLTRMEAASCAAIAAEVKHTIDTVPNSQCLVFLTYHENYDRMLSLLKDLADEVGVEVMNGTVPIKKRNEIVSRFQTGDTRVLLVGVAVGGAGLSLHDRLGGRPRFLWVVPNYSCIDMYQCTGRIYRPGTLSDCMARFVYCAQWPARGIMQKIQDKSSTVRATLGEGDKYVRLPDDYEDFIMPSHL